MAKERQYQSCEICGGFFIPHSSRNLVCPECRTKDLTRKKVDMANLSKNMRKREIAGIAAKKFLTLARAAARRLHLRQT